MRDCHISAQVCTSEYVGLACLAAALVGAMQARTREAFESLTCALLSCSNAGCGEHSEAGFSGHISRPSSFGLGTTVGQRGRRDRILAKGHQWIYQWCRHHHRPQPAEVPQTEQGGAPQRRFSKGTCWATTFQSPSTSTTQSSMREPELVVLII